MPEQDDFELSDTKTRSAIKYKNKQSCLYFFMVYTSRSFPEVMALVRFWVRVVSSA